MNNNHRNNRNTAPRNNQENTKNSYNKINTERGDTLIYAMGGLGEVGKNMYCFEHENEILIIDSGVRFPEENLLGVDYVIPDYNYLVKNNRKRKVLIITHGHEDHIGGIPFLLKSVDIEAIYAPAFAVALINKKLEERRMLRSVKIIEINDRSSVKMQHFTCGFFNTTHSIPDSLGILINTPNGRIVHTGDFKFDLTPVGTNSDYQVMAYMGQIGVDLLLSDSTNSGVEDFSISEKKVAAEILDTMKKTSGRLIVAAFASNVYRVSQILEAAVACGRKVIIFGRSMENVVTIGRKMGKIKVGEQHFLSPDQLGRTPANKTCIVCTGSQGEPVTDCEWNPPLHQADSRRYGCLFLQSDSGQRCKRQSGGQQAVSRRCQCTDKIHPEQSAYNWTCLSGGTEADAAADQAEILYADSRRIQNAGAA